MSIVLRVIIAAVFYYVEVPSMTWYNLIAVLYSILMVRWARQQKLKFTFMAASLEAILACTLAIYHIGWDSGFIYYFFLLIPVFFLYSKWTRGEYVAFLTIISLAFIGNFLIFRNVEAPYLLGEAALNNIETMNISLAFSTIMCVLFYFNSTIAEYEDRMLEQNDDLKKRNQEKEVMLKEIHHRVKNNLHVVNSIMELQVMEVEDEKIRSYLQDAQRRIITMATIHEKMYGSENLKYISVKEYFESFMRDLSAMYDPKKRIKLKLNIEEIQIDLDTLAPLAFLFNEIATNSYKHAFSDTATVDPEIICTMKASGERIFVVMADNGEGFEEKLSEADASIGIDLIYAFADELHANISRTVENGTVYRFDFNKKLVLPEIKSSK